MSKLLDVDSPVMEFMGKVADLVVLNLLAILCSLPILTIGAATTALYYSVAKLQNGDGNIYRSFFKGFKDNFVQSTCLWLIILVVGLGLAGCLRLYLNSSMAVLFLVALVISLIWGILCVWVFPLQARYKGSVVVKLRNALLCGLAYLPRTILLIVLDCVPILLLLISEIVSYASLVVFAIWFSLAALCSLKILQIPFERIEANTRK